MNSRSDHKFRNYKQEKNTKVFETYKQMHENQNLFFVKELKQKYTKSNIIKKISEVFRLLDNIKDDSDPDTKLVQRNHAYQTAESIKKNLNTNDHTKLKDISVKELFSTKEWEELPEIYQDKFNTKLHLLYPHITDWSWLPLIGYIHDLGKVLSLSEWGSQPQWAVVGDTFVTGAPFSKANVFYKQDFYKTNPDLDTKKNTKKHFGIYQKHCGFDHVEMSFGHDEYLYSVLCRNIHKIPEEGLYIIRFHSFYPWHTPKGGERGYTELASDLDWMRLPLLKLFQKSDLYSKVAELPDEDKLKNYYRDLLKKFIPNRIEASYDLSPAPMRW